MATQKTKPKAAGAATDGIKVTARPDTFRRGGYTFSAEARVIALSELTEEQLEQIEGEANLVCQRVTIDQPAAASAA